MIYLHRDILHGGKNKEMLEIAVLNRRDTTASRLRGLENGTISDMSLALRSVCTALDPDFLFGLTRS